MDVIIWAIILGAIFYINKKSKNAGSKNTQPNKPRPQQQKQMQQIWNSMQNTVQSGMNALNQTYQQKPQPQMLQRAHQPQKPQMKQRVQQPRPQQRVQPQQSNPDIVQRAMKNSARFAEDTTQKELETMHGHSEAQERIAQEHSRNCQTLHNKAADGAKIIEAETQSMFGSVWDLIAMGYSGNLEFERDFLGEGLDMINNF